MPNTKANNRNSSIELLRILCMFFVLIGHIFFHGAHNKGT